MSNEAPSMLGQLRAALATHEAAAEEHRVEAAKLRGAIACLEGTPPPAPPVLLCRRHLGICFCDACRAEGVRLAPAAPAPTINPFPAIPWQPFPQTVPGWPWSEGTIFWTANPQDTVVGAPATTLFFSTVHPSVPGCGSALGFGSHPSYGGS